MKSQLTRRHVWTKVNSASACAWKVQVPSEIFGVPEGFPVRFLLPEGSADLQL
jgi:hypothetical protein